LVLIRT